MAAIMLMEIWERLRGYDNWTEVEARILSSNLADVETANFQDRWGNKYKEDEWQSTCGIAWTDALGKEHSAKFKVSENSPLFQLYDGQTVAIRYNPANPEQFYLRGAAKSQMISTLLWKVIPAIVGIGFLLLWALKVYQEHTSQ